MWKSIFIESCILSALIFGGFYIHSKIIKDEIDVSEDSIKKMSNLAHISGNKFILDDLTKDHLSGSSTEQKPGHISGINQQNQGIIP